MKLFWERSFMNITIIGASRGIGKEILLQSLKAGHAVTVLARHPDKIEIKDEKLNIIKGDFLDYNSVSESVKNADVVVVSVGAMPTRKTVNLFSQGTKNLLDVIKKENLHPLIIAVTGIGAGDSRGHGGFFYNKIFQPLLLKTMYEDKDRQEQMLMSEYDNWIIVRPGMLTKGNKTGKYKAVNNLAGIKGGKISRADVAHFILAQTENPAYLRKTPLLIY